MSALAHAPSVLSRVGMASLWPEGRLHAVFLAAAQAGNLEAVLKLSTAFLYAEGVPSSVETAADMLIKMEEATGASPPFAWTMVRPPWPTNTSHKGHVFDLTTQMTLAYKVLTD